MMTTESEWKKNKLSVLTFNYDRSFEVFFFNCLQNRLNLTVARAAEMIHETVEIIHLHGKLGSIEGLDSAPSSECRPYLPRVTGDTVRVAANGIQIISEKDPNAKVFQRALALINQAEEVVCLGFGYNPVNVERIGLSKLESQKGVGSTFGMTNIERQQLDRLLHGGFVLMDGSLDAKDFLRNTACLGFE